MTEGVVKLDAFSIGHVAISTSREEFAAEKDLGDAYDTWLSNMSEETVIIDPDGRVINPYGRTVDLLELLRPILAHVPMREIKDYCIHRERDEKN